MSKADCSTNSVKASSDTYSYSARSPSRGGRVVTAFTWVYFRLPPHSVRTISVLPAPLVPAIIKRDVLIATKPLRVSETRKSSLVPDLSSPGCADAAAPEEFVQIHAGG